MQVGPQPAGAGWVQGICDHVKTTKQKIKGHFFMFSVPLYKESYVSILVSPLGKVKFPGLNKESEFRLGLRLPVLPRDKKSQTGDCQNSEAI